MLRGTPRIGGQPSRHVSLMVGMRTVGLERPDGRGRRADVGWRVLVAIVLSARRKPLLRKQMVEQSDLRGWAPMPAPD